MHKSKKENQVVNLIEQALRINPSPLPWEKAIGAGISAFLPVFVSLLFNRLDLGLIAGLGGFTYLYTMNEPYAFRAKKLFWVLISLSLSVGLGTFMAPYPVVSAITVSVIGAIVTLIFGAYQIPGPAGIFFVLVFLMSTGMPIDPESAPHRAGLVLLSGIVAWAIGMVGWLWKPHHKEALAVKKVYEQLTVLFASTGTEQFSEAETKQWEALKNASNMLNHGYSPWRKREIFDRLYLLNEQANIIYTILLERFHEQKTPISPDILEALHQIAQSIERNGVREIQTNLPVTGLDEDTLSLVESINVSLNVTSSPISELNHEVRIDKSSFKTTIAGALDKNSIVFITALRYGIVVLIASFIAFVFDFNRSYWVTLSCAAVISGATIVATFNRTIQRSFGTVIGIFIAAGILYLEPHGIVIAIAIMLFTTLTELAIVFNYGLAALFITPNALLIAESSSHLNDIGYFTSARVLDVIVGSIIGLLGVLFVGRKQASGLIPHIMAKTIRSQQQFLLVLFSHNGRLFDSAYESERRKMNTNSTNLRLMYSTAMGEIPVNKELSKHLRQAIFSIEHLGYLLEHSMKSDRRPVLSDDELAKLLFVFEAMAKSIEQRWSIPKKPVPEIPKFMTIQREIIDLQQIIFAMEKREHFKEDQ